MAPEGALEFLRREYASLREEIMKTQERRAQDERYGAAASVAIYAWLVTEHDTAADPAQPLLWFGWWLPVLIALAGAIRAYGHSRGIRRAGMYLARVEAAMGIGDLGWERHQARGADPRIVSASFFYTWLAAIGLTVMIALVATGMICGSQPCGPGALNEIYGYAVPPGPGAAEAPRP